MSLQPGPSHPTGWLATELRCLCCIYLKCNSKQLSPASGDQVEIEVEVQAELSSLLESPSLHQD